MSFIENIVDWSKWIAALPITGAIFAAWKFRRVFIAAWKYLVSWYNLPQTLVSIDNKLQHRPISTEAKFCASCDARMKVIHTSDIMALFKCDQCNVQQWHEVGKRR